MDDGKRHARPIGSGGMQALADVRTIGNHFVPEFPARVAHWSSHQAEGSPTGIRPHVKHTVIRTSLRPSMPRGKRDCITLRSQRDWMMFRVVFMVILARGDEPE